jgi:hypothetical protein
MIDSGALWEPSLTPNDLEQRKSARSEPSNASRVEGLSHHVKPGDNPRTVTITSIRNYQPSSEPWQNWMRSRNHKRCSSVGKVLPLTVGNRG